MQWLQNLRFAVEKIDISPLPNSAADKGSVDTIIQIVIAIVGALSILFITIGGFRYITSQGDPQAVSKAKGTIIGALIGVVIAVMAQAIVVFVLKGF